MYSSKSSHKLNIIVLLLLVVFWSNILSRTIKIKHSSLVDCLGPQEGKSFLLTYIKSILRKCRREEEGFHHSEWTERLIVKQVLQNIKFGFVYTQLNGHGDASLCVISWGANIVF